MKARNIPTISVLTLMLALSGRLCTSASETVPTERDRQVLEVVLLHLRSDANFNLTRITNGAPTIILHAHTPEKTGFLGVGQVRADLRDQNLPADVEDDMRARNTKPDARPDTYAAVPASYTNLTFSAGIVVTDLTGVWKNSRSFREFKEAHPDACGFVRAYLPGYSTDGNLAVVRATVGPTPHGASITALLEKVGTTWTVKWYKLARYV